MGLGVVEVDTGGALLIAAEEGRGGGLMLLTMTVEDGAF